MNAFRVGLSGAIVVAALSTLGFVVARGDEVTARIELSIREQAMFARAAADGITYHDVSEKIDGKCGQIVDDWAKFNACQDSIIFTGSVNRSGFYLKTALAEWLGVAAFIVLDGLMAGIFCGVGVLAVRWILRVWWPWVGGKRRAS